MIGYIEIIVWKYISGGDIMDRFSIRNGLQDFANQNNCTITTRRRIWQVFAKRHVLVDKGINVRYDVVEDILAYFGQEYQFDNSPFDNKDNCNRLNKYICERCEWYKVYEFICMQRLQKH